MMVDVVRQTDQSKQMEFRVRGNFQSVCILGFASRSADIELVHRLDELMLLFLGGKIMTDKYLIIYTM